MHRNKYILPQIFLILLISTSSLFSAEKLKTEINKHLNNPLFIGPNAYFLARMSDNDEHGAGIIQGGLEIKKFFIHDIENFGFGINFNTNYIHYSLKEFHKDEITSNMLGAQALLFFKTGGNRTFFCQNAGIGVETNFNDKNNFYIALASELLIMPKSLRYLFSLKFIWYIRPNDKNNNFPIFGFVLSFLFNIG